MQIPINRSPSTTGTWSTPSSVMRSSTVSRLSSGSTVTTAAVAMSFTGAPSDRSRTSRSPRLTIPAQPPLSSTNGYAPCPPLSKSLRASAIVAFTGSVTTFAVMASRAECTCSASGA